MREDIEEELKRKYDEIVVPDRIFDTTKIIQRVQEERRKRKLKIQRTVACIVVLVLVVSLAVVGVSLKINCDKTKNIDNNMGATENNENTENEIPEVSGRITVKGKETFLGNDFVNDICIVEVKKIINYEIVEGTPSTKIEAHVLKNYANNVEGDVEMIVPGGVFTVEEIKTGTDVEIKEDIAKYKNEEKVEVIYDNKITIPLAEAGKTYLTTVKRDEDKILICDKLEYGFKEYDTENNMVIDSDGNLIEVDLDKYVSDYIENK